MYCTAQGKRNKKFLPVPLQQGQKSHFQGMITAMDATQRTWGTASFLGKYRIYVNDGVVGMLFDFSSNYRSPPPVMKIYSTADST